jgi:hypothetical protein
MSDDPNKQPLTPRLSEHGLIKLGAMFALCAVAVALICVHQYEMLGGVAALAYFLFLFF